ncbi:MAG: tyrosine--tRNA ligase [Planctomycetes bacterium RBG_16_64_10]|nr:MAG: tyrosine--tRNA ligase [Planctomycetes bacterium RBG_16_64_10]
MLDLFSEFRWRGLIQQTTDDAHLPQWLATGRRTVYAGFDPTADSLHVGSLLPLLLLRRFQQAGHRPIALVGGATGMIGDPSGKSEERNLLPLDVLQSNLAGLESQMRALLDFDGGPTAAVLVNNADWMREFGYLDFLRDVGKCFSVGAMVAKDSVRSRLERDGGGLSYSEFSYMLLQAYDFVHLFDRYGCELQVGGSDQWGNITAGIDLGRRLRGVQLYGMTCPLLTKSDGSKMGKTEHGAVWLASARTSPYLFYQYWINVDDVDAGPCLRMLTELPRAEIEALDAARAQDPERRESQRRLAEELTRQVHGQAALEAAQRATRVFFGAEIDGLDDTQLGEIFVDVPSRELARSRLAGAGLPIGDALVEAGLCGTKSEARRLVQQHGAYVNNRRVDDEEMQLGPGHLASASILVLRRGKRRYALLRFV